MHVLQPSPTQSSNVGNGLEVCVLLNLSGNFDHTEFRTLEEVSSSQSKHPEAHGNADFNLMSLRWTDIVCYHSGELEVVVGLRTIWSRLGGLPGCLC